MICKDEVLFVFFSARAERSGASESGASAKRPKKHKENKCQDIMLMS